MTAWRRGPRPGIVVGVGSGATLELAQRLGEATSRPVLDCRLEELGECISDVRQPVAVVGIAQDLGRLRRWPIPDDVSSEAGLVTARSTESLTSLVERLIAPPPLTSSVTLVHPASPRARDAELASVEELAKSIESDRPALADALLEVDTFGRECCAHLPDGVLCGRDNASVPAGSDYLKLPNCLAGNGCFRGYLRAGVRVPASTVPAGLVFCHACHALAVGNNLYPIEVNVALGFLEGRALGVVGPVGTYEPSPSSERVFLQALADGQPLGACVRRLNEHADDYPGPARFGLLGDPGLSLVAGDRPAPTPAPEPSTALADDTLGRLISPASGTVDLIRRLEDLGRRVRRTRWRLADEDMSHYRERDRTHRACPRCGSSDAADVDFEPRSTQTAQAHHLRLTYCERCGCSHAQAGRRAGPGITCRASVDRGMLTLEIVPPEDAGALLVAFQGSDLEDLPPPLSRPVVRGRPVSFEIELGRRVLDDESVVIAALGSERVVVCYLDLGLTAARPE